MSLYSNKNGLCALTGRRLAALLVALWSFPAWFTGADGFVGPEAVIPASYDVAARVQITTITHSLRASDARRIQYGAPPPLVPYKVELAVHQTCPQVKLPRLRFEGIVATGWMPEIESRGILLLTESGSGYQPVAPFPCQGYLPEIEQDGISKIDFPPTSGYLVPASLVWECLCDLRSARAGTLPADRLEKWHGVFGGPGKEEAVAALFLLLNAPGSSLSMEALSARLAGMEGQAPLPPGPAVQLLAAFLPAEQAGAAVKLALDTAPHISADAMATFASNCLALAGRAPAEEQVALFDAVFARKWKQETGAETALIPEVSVIEAHAAVLEPKTAVPLLTRMLEEPSRFPALHRQPNLAHFWKLLSERAHPGLQDYLHRFLAQPTAVFLGIPMTAAAVEELVQIAKTLTKTS